MSHQRFLLFSIVLVTFFFFFSSSSSFGTIASPLPDSGVNMTNDSLAQNGTGTNGADNNSTAILGFTCAKASQNGFKIDDCPGTFTELFAKVVMTTNSEIAASSGKCQVKFSMSNHEKIDM
ncbi:hypothetical protein CROQUDRAFT_131115 [Cronartium quercuum f. sp. fusiforme G11]|uniref:Uncharacterized protein n=1 Tax=Cronartium quercuum f. sp. fusiforme G11 TaxID=708437 RepID=A0A9P6NSV6_9BASI|nr:hypothetical protein CROQUDRAFT_131115 [Cronartium quercuum f. sp. fusiforme G11]